MKATKARQSHIKLLNDQIAKLNKRGNKWHAVKARCGDASHGLHDSTKEANRCNELQLLQKGGEIEGLHIQVPYRFEMGRVLICTYKLDFRYHDARTQEWVYEDCKGKRTDVYVIKRKMMKAFYGIEITET